MTGAKPSWHCCLVAFFLLYSLVGMGRTDSLHHARLNAPVAHADRMHEANNSQQADFLLVSIDSILNDENGSQIHELKIIHETEKNRIEILKLQQKEQITQSNADLQNLLHKADANTSHEFRSALRLNAKS